MPSIISETFGDGDDKGLQLDNVEWGRELDIGTNWTRLRIGALFNLTPDGVNNISTAQLRMGISSGKAVTAGSQSAAHWWGLFLGGTLNSYAGGTWTYQAGSGNPYYDGTGRRLVKISGGSFGTGAGGAGTFARVPTNTGSTKRRFPIMVEFTKSGGNLSVGQCGITSTNTDWSLATFRAAMADTTTTTPPGMGGSFLSAPITETLDQATHGNLIAPTIGWNKGLTTLLQIFAIEVFRHA